MTTITKNILVLHGPNLNKLGSREPAIYGTTTLSDIENLCQEAAQEFGVGMYAIQSNHEGVLIDAIHTAVDDPTIIGVVANLGGYTHTSVALHDALRLLHVPIAEVHLSDPKKREEFRHFSFVESLAKISICGQGAAGYATAIKGLLT